MRLLFSFPFTLLFACTLIHAFRPFKLSSVQETLSLPWTSEHRGDLADHQVPEDRVQHATDRDMHLSQMSEDGASESSTLLKHIHAASGTMQSRYFELWIGTWPTSIDWTGAVLGTYVSSALSVLSRALLIPPLTVPTGYQYDLNIEDQSTKYFAHITTYYFGENAFAIRNEAYDDMLWVVLGWLESVKFISLHSTSLGRPWHGAQFVPAFAHRARIFYDITTRGWDTELCHGGMTWNPNLAPYKNAITNQLFIAASVGMYSHFPGDDNAAPFLTHNATPNPHSDPNPDFATIANDNDGSPPAHAHDPAYLRRAIAAYDWLRSSNMTNAKGLYVDGFHIRNWGRNHSSGTRQCDDRNEMVYTYNQGVVLSGSRGLWEATGNSTYLSDGHHLIHAVSRATGWDVSRPTGEEVVATSSRGGGGSPQWHGLGHAGVLEELCDSRASCDQNGQTFKGIFFLHLAAFCRPLPTVPLLPDGRSHAASKEQWRAHRSRCARYRAWVSRNARFASETRDKQGVFGAWWGAGVDAGTGTGMSDVDIDAAQQIPDGAVDYRNNASSSSGSLWTRPQQGDSTTSSASGATAAEDWQAGSSTRRERGRGQVLREDDVKARDSNDRGRGRTVETQGGGLAVSMAAWEFVQLG